jgi:hypothetical protein
MSPSPECHFYLHQGATAVASRPVCRQYIVNACSSLLRCGDDCVGIRVVATSSGQYIPLVGWANDRLVSGLDR